MNVVKVKSEDEIRYLLGKYNDRYVKPLSNKQIEELTKKFIKYASVYKAVENEVEFGYIAFYSNNLKEKKAFISQICVNKASTNRGIGKLLISECIKECREKDISLIQLSVYNNNKIAIEFYKRNGFYIFDEDNEEQCVYMEKNINKNGGKQNEQ